MTGGPDYLSDLRRVGDNPNVSQEELLQLGVPDRLCPKIISYPKQELSENFGCLYYLIALPILVLALFGVFAGVQDIWRMFDEDNGSILAGIHSDTYLLLLPVFLALGVAVLVFPVTCALQELILEKPEQARRFAAWQVCAPANELTEQYLVWVEVWFRKWALGKATAKANSVEDYLLAYVQAKTNLGWSVLVILLVVIIACSMPLQVWSVEKRDFVVRGLWFRNEVKRWPLIDASLLRTGCRTNKGSRSTSHNVIFELSWPDGEVQDLGRGYARQSFNAVEALKVTSNWLRSDVRHEWRGGSVESAFDPECVRAFGYLNVRKLLRF